MPVAVMPRVGCFSRAYMTPLKGGVEADVTCGGGGGGREPGEGGVDINDDDTAEREGGRASSGASLGLSRLSAEEASEDSLSDEPHFWGRTLFNDLPEAGEVMM